MATTPMGRIDLSELPEVPKKIEGVVVIDDMTVAISNDNDFDIGEFDNEKCNQREQCGQDPFIGDPPGGIPAGRVGILLGITLTRQCRVRRRT